MLVVATAMLFHHWVRAHLPAEPPEDYDGAGPPPSVPNLCGARRGDRRSQGGWRRILAVDYKPVFETGRTRLAALPADPDTGQAVRALAAMVAGISKKMSGLRQDLLGRIFHWVPDPSVPTVSSFDHR